MPCFGPTCQEAHHTKTGAIVNVMSQEKKLAIVSGLVEGVSIRSLERMTGAHSDSIVQLWQKLEGVATPDVPERPGRFVKRARAHC